LGYWEKKEGRVESRGSSVVEKSNSGQEKDMSYADDEGVNRPKLSLQPRGSTADNMSSPSPAKTSRPNPFGAARPREQVIAEREGKKETEVLKEQAHKEWKPNVRHTVSFLNLYFHISIFQLE
jgi:hypothetical protein